jgi:hypothetical protein
MNLCLNNTNPITLGMSKLSVIIILLLTSIGLFVAYNVLPFYYYYYELVGQMQSLVEVAGSNTDQELRKKLEYHMKKMSIPADIEDVVIVRRPGHLTISLEYQEIFYITWKDQDIDLYVFPFVARVEGDF